MHGTGKLCKTDKALPAAIKPTLCPSGVHHDASFERFSNPWHTRTPGPQQGPAAPVFQTAGMLQARFSVGMLQACYDY